MAMTREQAWDLLSKYNKEPFHLRHAITVEHVMGWFAEHLGYGEERELWSLVGLLHDLDFEMWPEEHCKKSQELMRKGRGGRDCDPGHGQPRLGPLCGSEARAPHGAGALCGG